MTLPARPRWYEPLPEVTATVDCEGESHRVTWRRGKLVLEAHDLAAERAMAVFGGDLCVCMQVLKMWQEQFGMPPEFFAQMQTWLGANAFLAPAEFSVVRELAMVLGWEREWRRTSYLNRKHEQLLQAQLKARAMLPLRQHLAAWKERSGARVLGAGVVKLLRSDEAPVMEGRIDRVSVRASVSLVPRWITDVWAKGVGVVDGAFVLGLTEAISRTELAVRAVRWEAGSDGVLAPVDAPATLSYRGQAWRLDWHDGVAPAPPP